MMNDDDDNDNDELMRRYQHQQQQRDSLNQSIQYWSAAVIYRSQRTCELIIHLFIAICSKQFRPTHGVKFYRQQHNNY